MNAAETLKQTSASTDQRAYEPSMEEILASIRRIIADDQSLPNRDLVRDGEVSLRAALDSVETRPLTEPAVLDVDSPKAADLPPLHTAEASTVLRHQPPEMKAAPPASRVASAASSAQIATPRFSMPNRPVAPDHAPRKEPASASVFAHPHPSADLEPMQRKDQDVSRFASSRDGLALGSQIIADRPAPNTAQITHKSETVIQQPETDTMSSLFSTATDQTVTAAFNTLTASRLLENDDALKDMVHDMIRPLLKTWLDDNLPNLVERLVRAEIERVARGGR